MRWRRFWLGCLRLMLSPLILLWLPPLLLATALLWPTIPPALISQIERLVPGLTLNQVERLGFSTLAIGHFDLDLPVVKVTVEEAVVALDLTCSWRLTLCVDKVEAKQVSVAWRQVESSADDDEAASEPGLGLPLTIEVRELVVSSLSLAGSGISMSGEAINGAVILDDEGIKVPWIAVASYSLQLSPAADRDPPQRRGAAPSAPQPLTSDLAAIALPFTLVVGEARLGQLRVVDGNEPQQITDLYLEGRWAQTAVEVTTARASWQGYRAQLAGSADLVGALPLALQLEVTHPGWPRLTAVVDGSLARPQWQLSTDGDKPLRLLGSARLDDPQLPFVAVGYGKLPPLPTPLGFELDNLKLGLIGNRSNHWLAGRGSLSSNQASLTWRLRSAGRWLSRSRLLARAEMDNGRLTWHGDVRYNEAQGWQLAGRLAGHGLPLQRLWPQLPSIERLAGGVVAGWRNSDDWRLQLHAVRSRFRWQGQSWRLHAGLSATPEAINIDRLYLTSERNRLTAFGTAGAEWAIRGEADLDAALVTPLGGRLKAMWSLTGERAQPLLSLQGQADVGDGASALQLSGGQFKGQSQLVSPYRHLWQVTADQLRLGDSHGRQLTFSGVGDQDGWQWQSAAADGDLQWQLRGDGALNAGQMRWTLSAAELTANGQTVTLSAPLSWQSQPDGWTLSPHCWRGSPLDFCLNRGLQQGNQSAFEARLERLDLSWLGPWLPSVATAEGVVAGSFNLAHQSGQPWQIAGQLAANQGVLILDDEGVAQRYPWHDLLIKIGSTAAAVQLSAQLEMAAHGRVAMTLDTPNRVDGEQPIQGRLEVADFALALVDPWLGDDLELDGLLNGQLTVTGPRSAPQVDGEIRATGLKAKAVAVGVNLDDGDLNLRLHGDRVLVQGQLLADGGSAVVSGQLDWAGPLHGDLHLAGLNWPLEHEMAQLRLDSDLQLAVAEPELALTGTVTVREGLVRVAELPASAVSVSSDEVVIQQAAVATDSQWRTRLELVVKLGERLRLDAFGLTGRFTGQLRARDNGDGLALLGEVAVRDGRFKAYGQNLIMRRATLGFSGAPTLPVFNIEAIRDPDETEDGVVAGLRVVGVPGRADVSVFSEPSLSEQRALSYLIQGRDLEDAEGGNDMAVAALGMGISTTGSLVGDVGSVFGVDDLALGTSGSGDNAKVVVSGNLLPGISVRYGRGIFSAVSELTVRVRLLRNLYLEAVSSTDNALDFIYRFEF